MNFTRFAAALALAACLASGRPALAQEVRHPLDPLTQAETQATVDALRASGKVGKDMLFPMLTLAEPAKEWVRAWKPGQPFARQAFVVVLDRGANKTYEAVVDLGTKKVTRFEHLPGVQPGVLVEEFKMPAAIVRADPRWQAAMRRRGITDFENVQIDTWAPGILKPEHRQTGARLLRTLSYYRGPGGLNPYSRPIEGVYAVVDANSRRVLDVVDTGVVHVNKEGGLFNEDQHLPLRTDLKPLIPQQPEGASFTLNGHEVSWQGWTFHFVLHPREGAVVQDVKLNGRPVMYRGSLSEMVVPYGDPDREGWSWRNAFDLGEYGVGRLADTLRLGVDVPSNATLVDAVFADDEGKPYVQEDAIAIYERDGGILWKHYDFDTGHDETRRARELVVQYVATVGNYDYALSWVFGQDGNLSVQADLTGIVLAKGVDAAKVPHGTHHGSGLERYGRLVGPHIVAPNHQHFFNFRLDMDVDGTRNRLMEMNNVAVPPGPANPDKNAFVMEETTLADETQARRNMDLHTHRMWMVVSADQQNSLGGHTGYMLMPGENSFPYLAPDSEVRERARFVDYHVWGTRYRADELNGGGFYPNQSRGGDGLAKWSNGERIDAEDLVLWYTVGVTHNPRPEEWPVMPKHRTGFMLMPNGFFGENPTLNLPDPGGK